ncbi:MAG: diguanylate cyclase domain-containing protein [Candidatus Baltobacteraceae bacterium]
MCYARALAVTPLMVSGAQESYRLMPHCDAAAGDIGFDHIIAGTKFSPLKLVKPDSFPAVVWLRCRFQNADPRDHRLWLVTMDNDVARADIYQPTPQGYRMAITGMRVPFNERTDRYYYPAFALDDDTFSGRPVYMHVVYYQYFPLTMSVRSEHRNVLKIEPFRIVEGVFFGVLLAVALFNLFVFITMRDRSTLLYVAYIGALILNELAATGIGAQYLWPNHAWDERWVEWLTATASFGTALFFVRSFLQTRKTIPIWDVALISCFAAEAMMHFAIVSFFVPIAVFGPLLLCIQLLGMMVTSAAGIVRWRQGFAAARFFVIGFVPAMLGYFVNLAYNVYAAQLPPGNWFWAENGVELGAMFQSVLISFSLLDRIRVLDRQKEEAHAELTVVSQEALRLHDLALHDPLTGLANRMLFTEELGRALLRAKRKNTQIGVLFADLDGFKPINDVYGHRVGDLVLKGVAERLKDTLRRADMTARLGGDEFAIIVEDLTSREQADQICETVGKLLETPILIDNTAMPLGISVGVAIFPEDGTGVDQLLHAADLRMYATKEGHKRGTDPLAARGPLQSRPLA